MNGMLFDKLKEFGFVDEIIQSDERVSISITKGFSSNHKNIKGVCKVVFDTFPEYQEIVMMYSKKDVFRVIISKV